MSNFFKILQKRVFSDFRCIKTMKNTFLKKFDKFKIFRFLIIDILPYDFYREVSKIFCQIFQNGFLQNVPHKKVWNFNWGTFVLIINTKNLANNVCFFNNPKWLKAIFWPWYKRLLTKFFAYNKTTDSHEYFVKKIMKIRSYGSKVWYFKILLFTTLYLFHKILHEIFQKYFRNISFL